MIHDIFNERNSSITYRGIYTDEIDNFNLFSSKFQKSKQENPCTICGRKTSGIVGVYVGAGGDSLVHPEDVEKAQDGGWMGFFAIGNECIKKVPKELHVTEGEDN